MSQLLFTNDATTTLAGSISTGSATCIVAAGTGGLFPSPAAGQFFKVSFRDAATGTFTEIVHCTARVGDTLTITRGQEGTAPRAWSAGDYASLECTAGSLQQFIQADTLLTDAGGYAADTSGGANTITIALSTVPANYAALLGSPIRIKKNGLTNTVGGVTIDANGLGGIVLLHADGTPIGDSELPANGILSVVHNGTVFVLQSLAHPLPSLAVGPSATVRLSANLTAAGTTVVFTADQVAVATMLGGPAALLTNFTEALNVATTGAGGMDAGSAPISGFVSIYAIYNPTNGATALLGTGVCQTTTYTGGSMPSGFTMSSLLAIWNTDGSRNLISATVVDREYNLQVSGFPGQQALNAGTATAATSVSLATLVPAAARAVLANFVTQDTMAIDASSLSTFGSTTGLHQVFVTAQVTAVSNSSVQWIAFATPQTIYYASGDADVQSTVQILGYRL